jgi:tRNA (cmo5U34)-methyltransferase
MERNLMSVEDEEKPENMAAFFDTRAAGYDEHMRGFVFNETTITQFYQAVSSPIEKTSEPLKVLDLGCGTGLELEALIKRVPNACITGVDLSKNMLALLQKRYASYMHYITLVEDSYLSMPFGTHTYDHIISAMSMHHLLHDTKRNFYKKIHSVLQPGGKYIEGDSVTPVDMESQFLAEYQESLESVPPAEEGYYHVDIPSSIGTQKRLLLEAGFKDFQLIWQMDSTAVWDIAVYAVTK